jgi:hypothetical protein
MALTTGCATTYEEGSLVLDFVDTKTNHLVWRGSTKANIDYVNSPDERWETIKIAVRKILGNYPPPLK